MDESFGIQSWPEGLLATEKSPNLKELEPAFNTKTLTLPDFVLVLLLMHRAVVFSRIFLIVLHMLATVRIGFKNYKVKPKHDLCFLENITPYKIGGSLPGFSELFSSGRHIAGIGCRPPPFVMVRSVQPGAEAFRVHLASD